MEEWGWPYACGTQIHYTQVHVTTSGWFPPASEIVSDSHLKRLCLQTVVPLPPLVFQVPGMNGHVIAVQSCVNLATSGSLFQMVSMLLPVCVCVCTVSGEVPKGQGCLSCPLQGTELVTSGCCCYVFWFVLMCLVLCILATISWRAVGLLITRTPKRGDS